MSSVDDFLGRFEKVKELRDDRWQARCPAHDDQTPSLSIMLKPSGDWLLHCHAGCAIEDVAGAAGIAMSDLFANPANGNGHREIVATYDYTDESGELLFQVVRFAPKDFRQRRPDGIGGWEWNLNGTRRVLYRLPRVLEAVQRGEDILITEGERDVEALEKLGIAATCNPGGAGRWRDDYSESLRGGKVTIVADRDEVGYDHARQVAESLRGVAAELDCRASGWQGHLGSPRGRKVDSPDSRGRYSFVT